MSRDLITRAAAVAACVAVRNDPALSEDGKVGAMDCAVKIADLPADTELARLRALIAGLDPDHWGLQARVVALKAEALREGGA